MHTGTLHSQWFLSQQEIVPQPSLIKLLATMLEETAYCFVSLQWVHHWLRSYECGLQEFLWYGFRTSDRMYQAWNICPCTDRNCNYCVFTAYHTIWNVILLFLKRQGKNYLCICIYCQFKCLTRENKSPNIYSNESNSTYINYLNV